MQKNTKGKNDPRYKGRPTLSKKDKSYTKPPFFSQENMPGLILFGGLILLFIVLPLSTFAIVDSKLKTALEESSETLTTAQCEVTSKEFEEEHTKNRSTVASKSILETSCGELIITAKYNVSGQLAQVFRETVKTGATYNFSFTDYKDEKIVTMVTELTDSKKKYPDSESKVAGKAS